MKKTIRTRKKIGLLLLFTVIFAIIVLTILFFSVYFSAKLDKNSLIAQKAEITVLSRKNKEVENNFLSKYVSYNDISPHVVNAFVALEDKRFFKHNGVDYYRLFGAIAKDISTLSLKEGGSTITQQLAKNTMLSNEKTIKRKIKEMRLAHLIEQNYSKEKIMEMYLNAIYFGNGIYGIDAASKTYFKKDPLNLSPSESAILAGIVKNPSKYSPQENEAYITNRRNLVLRLMLEQNYIDENTYSKSINEEYVFIKNKDVKDYFSPYFYNVVKEAGSLLGLSDEKIITSSYKIYTGYDDDEQKSVSKIIQSKEYSPEEATADYSVLLAKNESGEISSFYSTNNIIVSEFKRQPASTIKPILVYSPAIEKGIVSPSTSLLDEAIDINGYSPKNYGNRYAGWITAEKALIDSVNTVAVKLYNETGVDYAKKIAEKFGMRFHEKDGLSAALGGLTNGLSQAELCSSYMALASGGDTRQIHFIRKITDKNGKILYQFNQKSTKAVSADTAYLVTEMLTKTVQEGTAKKLNGFSYDIASKTGTAQNPLGKGNRDAWNISYTTENTMVVWYGTEQGKEGINTTGGNLPTMLAKKIYTSLPSPQKKDFPRPETIVDLEIDAFAQETDHALFLTNNFTPTKYRKKCIFSITNCPTTVSPYFDLKKINFLIDKKDFDVSVTIVSGEKYNYILEETDLFTRIGKEYKFDKDGVYSIPSSPFYALKAYKLHIFYENEELGTIFPQRSKEYSLFISHNELFQRFPMRI